MRLSLMLPLVAATLAAACAPSSAPAAAAATVDTAAATAGIVATRTKYSALQIAGDATGIAGLFDENATLDIYGSPAPRAAPASRPR